jgi:pilus assembly protein Flp/PilA
MYVNLRAFAAEDEGQDLVEYALICALLALATVATFQSLTAAMSTEFSKLAASI